MNVLITGGSGYVGGFLIQRLLDSPEVAQLHFLYNSKSIEVVSSTKVSISAHKCDISDEEVIVKLITEIRPDVVVHLAAASNTAFCEKKSTRGRTY